MHEKDFFTGEAKLFPLTHLRSFNSQTEIVQNPQNQLSALFKLDPSLLVK